MAEEKVKKAKKEAKPLTDIPWVYYKYSIKLTNEMLGACSSGSIWSAHILAKAKKEIAKMNRLATKAKKLDADLDISVSKEVQELQSVIRGYQEMLGKKEPLPSTITELLELSAVYEEEYRELTDGSRVTIFMRGPDKDEKGNFKPCISTHIILGNLKEILRCYKESGQHTFINSSKIGCDRMMALDIKPVERFVYPSIDIKRNEDGTPFILERPIRFTDEFGNEKTAISMSEVLPEGAKFECTLRCRNGSTIAEMDNLIRLFENGKNLGYGPWRGSGNKGAYLFKLDRLVDYAEAVDAEGYR